MTAAAHATIYEVEAYNTSKQSDNKIHDDAVARKFGFAGGLVPGVDVYAYLTHPAVERWGRDWLERGAADCRLLKPVYDGALATITTEAIPGEDNAMTIRVESAGQLCAQGTARLPDAAPVAADLADFPLRPLPAERPPASPETLPKDALLGTYEMEITADFVAGYLRDVRETLPLYGAQGLVHPGVISRFGNWALTQNVGLGPWIHVGSDIQHFSAAMAGEKISVRARVTANNERKGHLFVELDAVVLAGGGRIVARIDHTAIYEPRQVRA
jgi:acyl dehydratase